MKLTINFDTKTITVQEKVNFNTLLSTIKKMFPENWKDFELDTNTTVVYSTPQFYWNGYWTNTPTYQLTEPLYLTTGTLDESTTNVTYNTPTTGCFTVDVDLTSNI